tara:strand:- start:34 stop:330 length:297 start_codon:yes stop_codon:yes gene_type:complete
MYTPESFEIFGQTITVKYSNCIRKLGAVGLYEHDSKVITVATHDIDDKPHDEDFMSATLYHEIIHVLLSYTGQYELNMNEQMVELMGQCLYQVLKTMK